MITKRKAFAYITRGNDLLLFRHLDFPEAGLQVPAGTVEEGETPPIAALREAAEETGLDELTLIEYLGYQERDMSDYGKAEIHQRYFYHLYFEGETPPRWQHIEGDPSDGTTHSIRLELFWVRLAVWLDHL